MAQIDLYLEAISKLEGERLRSMAIAARSAQADDKSFKKFMKGFE